MNVIARLFAELTGRKPQPDMTIRCSIHTGSDLTEIHRFTIEDDDLAAFTMRAGTVLGLTLDLPAGTPRAFRLMHSSLDQATTAFIRVTLAGSDVEQWLRMQSWNTAGTTVTAEFTREYSSHRWNERDGYFTEILAEPSPPVPFDEHHPHYEGSAQQHRTDLAYDVGGSF